MIGPRLEEKAEAIKPFTTRQARHCCSVIEAGQGVPLALERARPSRGYFTGTLIGGARSSEPDHPSGVAEPALSLSQELRTPAT